MTELSGFASVYIIKSK